MHYLLRSIKSNPCNYSYLLITLQEQGLKEKKKHGMSWTVNQKYKDLDAEGKY